MMAEPQRSASFSRCRRYRYQLRRRWIDGKGTCVFIGLNPSVADANSDDPTIRRCMGFARDWGYRQLLVVNLFAFRTAHPAVLRKADDPVGPNNQRALTSACRSADIIVAAWGANGSFNDQANKLSKVWKKHILYCFATTNQGHPVHPLYQRRDAILKEFN